MENNLMKKSIIEEIYFNNLNLSEQAVSSDKYKNISDKAYKFYSRLIEVLDDEQKKIFESFTDAEIDVCAEGEFLNFKEGLKVGLLLAMECLI